MEGTFRPTREGARLVETPSQHDASGLPVRSEVSPRVKLVRMSNFNTEDMAAALPTADGPPDGAHHGPPEAPPGLTPQQYGWVRKTEYDYDTYNKSTKELLDTQGGVEGAPETFQAEPNAEIEEAVGGIRPGEWANNAAIYQWDEDFGDIGPAHPELEKMLFGSANHVKSGINFEAYVPCTTLTGDCIAKIDVVHEGVIRIKPIKSFADAGLHPAMLTNVKLAGYDVPTPIQQFTIPCVIEGHDLVACAQTGSGKTAAFLIPILSKLMGKAKKIAAPRPNPVTFQPGITAPVRAEPLVLIVAPSRELATQIFDEARRFCYRTMLRPCVVYGGGPLGEQIQQLARGCDVLIGTPGRLCDFINRPNVLTLKRLRYMVIDEADEMLNTDWELELKQIMSGGDQEEGNIKYLMFSATFPKIAHELALQHLSHDHVHIRVGRAGSSHVNIKQDIVFVDAHAKRKALFDLLMSAPPARTIIFVNSKRTADETDDYLFNLDIPCTSIHSGRTQREREDSIRAFRSGKAPVLIATGVSARGLDIHNVLHVINYDLPSFQYGGIQEYTHRIGRTGRIGNKGLATSFFNDRDIDIAEVLVKTLLETQQIVPDFLEQYIPEGFAPDAEGNVTGKIEDLKFENDSDDGEGVGSGNGGGWGEASVDTPAEEAQAAEPSAPNAQAEAPQAPQPTQPVQEFGLPAAPAWNAQAPQALQPTRPAQEFGLPAEQSGGPQHYGAPVQTFTPQAPVAQAGPPQGQVRLKVTLVHPKVNMVRPKVTMAHLKVTMAHLKVNMVLFQLSRVHLKVNMFCPKVTMVHLKVNMLPNTIRLLKQLQTGALQFRLLFRNRPLHSGMPLLLTRLLVPLLLNSQLLLNRLLHVPPAAQQPAAPQQVAPRAPAAQQPAAPHQVAPRAPAAQQPAAPHQVAPRAPAAPKAAAVPEWDTPVSGSDTWGAGW
ncbi:DEAD/DEAH box helicase [Drepanopeziza brunnea f. sp. 'multigermtubi' MB_m1]|uniref:RNA helicase n=1 Tax=Marssonina brunnea f. sp. multigermtubi (strain MB_m1) TaxID=1072389 RepID=K1X928_MARBU|nr:DEAD/DEAH box helicase [Drepanopeziza brunnea f. sp. 'multigermtubi' MB_m1]EKD21527.1 DEAD/DEAH box helicase [Drepanopeziza brunnea f. sp. 'multigermtubi' MB_m1]